MRKTEDLSHLIRNHGSDFVAVEGDWPPGEKVNQFLVGEIENIWETLKAFDRWPTWMWANLEFSEFLNVYFLMESIDEVIHSLSKIDWKLADEARKKYACFDPYRHDEKEYARSLFLIPDGCEKEVASIRIFTSSSMEMICPLPTELEFKKKSILSPSFKK